MKIEITGASNFVNRMYQAAAPYQWAREFLMNSLEAGATRVDFGIEWEGVAKHGVHRRTVSDNGTGMCRKDLVSYFSTMGAGAKVIGGVHDNFGIGAKLASLPWNPEGLVVLSYFEGTGSMIWIRQNAGEYELAEFDTVHGPAVVIEPSVVDDIDWACVAPPWCWEHGTCVVLLGSKEHPNTIYGDPTADEADIKGLSVYLNTRFWQLAGAHITVAEPRSVKLPRGPKERDTQRRVNNRTIEGAKYYLTDVEGSAGRSEASGTVSVAKGRALVHWYLWKGERPAIHSYARKSGYLAAKYRQELFELSHSKPDFRAFGVVESLVQDRLTLILEPQELDPTAPEPWGVHPDQSRARLLFTGEGQRGAKLPLYDWGVEFATNMPGPVLEAIRQARAAEGTGMLEDEEYRKRLQERFGSRWSVPRLVEAPSGEAASPHNALDNPHISNMSGGRSDIDSPGRRLAVRSRREATPSGDGLAVEAPSPVDVPRYVFAMKQNFELPWHMACWAPHDPNGPTVLINVDSPMLHDLVDHHRAQFPDHHAEEVGIIVMRAVGEIAACKVAHCQRLTKLMPEEQVDREYRSEAALTVGLMGLIAEEAVIARRLTKLGRKLPEA